MFVAAIPPDSVTEDLDDFLSVRRDAAGFRWTLPEHWHLTLAFLPAVPDRVYDELVERLATAASRRRPLRATIAGGGAFPDPARARVLWAGLDVDDPDELDQLARGCRAAATKAGVETPGERFRPHLTLARNGRPFEATKWLRVLDGYRGPTYDLDTVSLVASHLGEGPNKRPRYEVMAEIRLGTGPETDPPAN